MSSAAASSSKPSKRTRSPSPSSSSGSSSGSDSDASTKKKDRKKEKKKEAKKKKEKEAKKEKKKKEETKEAKKKEDAKQKAIAEATQAVMDDDAATEQKSMVVYDPGMTENQKRELAKFKKMQKEMDKFKQKMAKSGSLTKELMKSSDAVEPVFHMGKTPLMQQMFHDWHKKLAKLRKGEEVQSTNPDEALFLYCKMTNSCIHWTDFYVETKINAWFSKKASSLDAVSKYASFRHNNPVQSFGPLVFWHNEKLKWREPFVMLTPFMAMSFTYMGPEGDYTQLGVKPYGPETKEKLSNQIQYTNEVVFPEICDENGLNPVAEEFFDMLERIQAQCIRKVGLTGLSNLQNAIRTANAAKKPPVQSPQSDDEWMSWILQMAMNSVVSTNVERGIRSINPKSGLFRSPMREKTMKRNDPDAKLLPPDDSYVPIDTEHHIYVDVWNNKVENGQDKRMVRKDPIRILLPHVQEEIGVQLDIPSPKVAFPFTQAGTVDDIHMQDKDISASFIGLGMYDNINLHAGMQKKLLATIWLGRQGSLPDPGEGVHPLLAIPMASKYTFPDTGAEATADQTPKPAAAASAKAASTQAKPAAASAKPAAAKKQPVEEKKEEEEAEPMEEDEVEEEAAASSSSSSSSSESEQEEEEEKEEKKKSSKRRSKKQRVSDSDSE